MFHVAARILEIRCRMMPQRRALIGLPPARARRAFQICNVFPVDRSVVDRTVFDFGDRSARFHRRRSDRQARGIGSRRAGQRRRAASLNMIHDGFRQAQFAGGGNILHLVAFFESAQSDDAPAVLQDNRIRRCPPAHGEQRNAQQNCPNWESWIHAPRLSILNRSQGSARSALFPHAASDYTSRMRVWGIFFSLWCLLAPAVFPATEISTHELYDAIKSLPIDSSNVYRIAPPNHIPMRRRDAVGCDWREKRAKTLEDGRAHASMPQYNSCADLSLS